MTERPVARWQFSLRALLLFMLICVVAMVGWRILGADAFSWIAFAVASVMPIVTLKGPSRIAYLVSHASVYGPFVVMATYTFFYVPCSHCKEATWAVLPYGPGMLPVDLGRRWLDLPRLDDQLWFGVALLVAAGLVVGLTWFLRTRGHAWQVVSVTAALALSSFSAIVLLALIRA
jgi:hypothetical protein